MRCCTTIINPQMFAPLAANRLILGLGANQTGIWGEPRETLSTAVSKLRAAGLSIVRVSSLFESRAIGALPQPDYLNAVVVARSTIAPGQLLRALKQLERSAGRRSGPRWGPRPLDIDIVDYGGRILGWPPHGEQRPHLTLPHPEAHRRSFVLVPLLEVVPRWVHPAFAISGWRLLSDLVEPRSQLRRILDSSWVSCHVNSTGTAAGSGGVATRVRPLERLRPVQTSSARI